MIPFSYSASGAQGPARRANAPAVEQGRTPLEKRNHRAWHGYGPPPFNGNAPVEWSHLNQLNAPFLHYYSNAVAQNPGINNVPRYNQHSINDHLQMQQSYVMAPQFQYPSNPLHSYSAQYAGSLQGPAAVAPIMSNRPNEAAYFPTFLSHCGKIDDEHEDGDEPLGLCTAKPQSCVVDDDSDPVLWVQ